MILEWMLYAALVALLLGLGARALEGAAGERGWPVRWLWVGALAGSALVPALGLLLARLREAELLALAPAPTAAPAGAALLLDPLAAIPAAAPDLDGWLAALWAGTAALGALAIAFSYLALRRRARGWSRRTVDGHEVWVAPDTGPAVVGFVRSRIVLPEWVLERGEAERAMVLAHEAEHLRAGDPRLLLGALLLVAACPWNPALWWQGRRLRQAIEVDCDARVLRRGVDARSYGRLLMEVTERGGARRLVVAALGESQSSLERRIRHMFTPRSRGGWLRLAGALALAAICVLVACQADIPSGPTNGLALAPSASEAAPSQGPVYELKDLDRAPALSNSAEIASVMERLYPSLLRNAGIGGTAIVRFVIGTDGKAIPSTIRVVDTPREELGAASVAAVRAFEFRPGQRGGQAVNTVIQMPVTWQPNATAASPNRVPIVQRPEEVPAPAAAPNAQGVTIATGQEPEPSFAYELAVLDRHPALVNQGEVAATMERLYPPVLQEAGIGGTVVAQFVIKPDGLVDPGSVRIIDSPRQELSDATTKVLEQFRFRPGQYRGRDVRVLIQMPITWQPRG